MRLDGVTVWVRPKVPVARLLWLLGYAKKPGWQVGDLVSYLPDGELVPLLADAYATQAERAIAAGLLQGYRQVDEASPVLRGRLRTDDQLRRQYGIAVPLLVRYDDHTTDIAENRILRAASDRLAILPGVGPATRLRVRRPRHDLDVTPLTSGGSLPAWQPTRLNARYHDALWLAELILAGGAVEHGPGGIRLQGFLVDMYKVFEDFATAALGIALAAIEGNVAAQDPNYLDEASEVKMRPDLVWYITRHPAAVIDAKYKPEKPWGFPDADLYQLLAYTTALLLDQGHLVYAKGNEASRHWRIRNTGITITAHTLDLQASPLQILADVDGLAARSPPPSIEDHDRRPDGRLRAVPPALATSERNCTNGK